MNSLNSLNSLNSFIIDSFKEELPIYEKNSNKKAIIIDNGKTIRSDGRIEDDHKRIAVPMYPLSKEMLCGFEDAIKIAEDEGCTSCALVVNSDSSKVGFVAI